MIATATIAPLAGVITLGDPIINVNTYGDEGRLAAAIVVAAPGRLHGAAARRRSARRDAAGLKLDPTPVTAHEIPDHRREATT